MASDPLGDSISGLNAADTLTGAEIVPVTQSTVTRRTTLQLIADWIVQTAASFVQSGTGAIAETVQDALRRMVFTGQYSSAANFNTARDALTDTAGVGALSIKTGAGIAASENLSTGAGLDFLNIALSHDDAPFQIQISAASENSGAGAGTWNHGTFFGYNTQRHSGQGTATPNTPSLILGFENDYYDNGHGSEWYVEYWSPDGTSVTLYRPLYLRIENDDNSSHGAQIYNDIGSDGTGTWLVKADSSHIIVADSTSVALNKVTTITGGSVSILTENTSLQFGAKVQNATTNNGTAAIAFSADPTYYKAAIGLQRSDANGKGDLLFMVDPNSDAANVAIGDLALTLNSTAAVFAGSIKTSAPTGGAGAWELGIANAVSPTSPDRTLTVEIGGTVYYIHAKTTND